MLLNILLLNIIAQDIIAHHCRYLSTSDNEIHVKMYLKFILCDNFGLISTSSQPELKVILFTGSKMQLQYYALK